MLNVVKIVLCFRGVDNTNRLRKREGKQEVESVGRKELLKIFISVKYQ